MNLKMYMILGRVNHASIEYNKQTQFEERIFSHVVIVADYQTTETVFSQTAVLIY